MNQHGGKRSKRKSRGVNRRRRTNRISRSKSHKIRKSRKINRRRRTNRKSKSHKIRKSRKINRRRNKSRKSRKGATGLSEHDEYYRKGLAEDANECHQKYQDCLKNVYGSDFHDSISGPINNII